MIKFVVQRYEWTNRLMDERTNGIMNKRPNKRTDGQGSSRSRINLDNAPGEPSWHETAAGSVCKNQMINQLPSLKKIGNGVENQKIAGMATTKNSHKKIKSIGRIANAVPVTL